MSSDNTEDALEELADILEIVHALADYHGASIQKVEEIRRKKQSQEAALKRRYS